MTLHSTSIVQYRDSNWSTYFRPSPIQCGSEKVD